MISFQRLKEAYVCSIHKLLHDSSLFRRGLGLVSERKTQNAKARAAMAAPTAATAPGDIAVERAAATPAERSKLSRSPCAQLALAELAVHAATAMVVLANLRMASSSAYAVFSSAEPTARLASNAHFYLVEQIVLESVFHYH